MQKTENKEFIGTQYRCSQEVSRGDQHEDCMIGEGTEEQFVELVKIVLIDEGKNKEFGNGVSQ